MVRVVLSRKQIEQLSLLMSEYVDEDCIALKFDSTSGIGCSVTAIVKYATGTREDHRDITDYELW